MIDDFESQWRRIAGEVEDAMKIWSYNDSTQREFYNRYWREIDQATSQYRSALRQLSEAIEALRRLPCI